jgi:hypothetical protein
MKKERTKFSIDCAYTHEVELFADDALTLGAEETTENADGTKKISQDILDATGETVARIEWQALEDMAIVADVTVVSTKLEAGYVVYARCTGSDYQKKSMVSTALGHRAAVRA